MLRSGQFGGGVASAYPNFWEGHFYTSGAHGCPVSPHSRPVCSPLYISGRTHGSTSASHRSTSAPPNLWVSRTPIFSSSYVRLFVTGAPLAGGEVEAGRGGVARRVCGMGRRPSKFCERFAQRYASPASGECGAPSDVVGRGSVREANLVLGSQHPNKERNPSLGNTSGIRRGIVCALMCAAGGARYAIHMYSAAGCSKEFSPAARSLHCLAPLAPTGRSLHCLTALAWDEQPQPAPLLSSGGRASLVAYRAIA